MNDPIWIRMDVVLAIHKRQISEHGGDEEIRHLGLLDSAMARPKKVVAFAKDAFDLAAAYSLGIVTDPAFVDGNKRVAYVVCMTFLKLNGLVLDVKREEKYETFVKLAAGSIDGKALAEWLRANSTKC